MENFQITINNNEIIVYYFIDYIPYGAEKVKEENSLLLLNCKKYSFNNPNRKIQKFLNNSLNFFYPKLNSIIDMFIQNFDHQFLVVVIPSSKSNNVPSNFQQFILRCLRNRTDISTEQVCSLEPQNGNRDQIRNGNYNPNTIFTGRTIILIDDVYTTGNTFSRAAKFLQTQGATKIVGLIFGKTKR